VKEIHHPDALAHYVAKAEEAVANELAATEAKHGHRAASRSQVDLARWVVVDAAAAAQAKETGTRIRLPMTKHQRARLRDGRIEIQSAAGLTDLHEDRDEAVLEDTKQLTAGLAFLDGLVHDLVAAK
jgi:hypothetical protein